MLKTKSTMWKCRPRGFIWTITSSDFLQYQTLEPSNFTRFHIKLIHPIGIDSRWSDISYKKIYIKKHHSFTLNHSVFLFTLGILKFHAQGAKGLGERKRKLYVVVDTMKYEMRSLQKDSSAVGTCSKKWWEKRVGAGGERAVSLFSRHRPLPRSSASYFRLACFITIWGPGRGDT